MQITLKNMHASNAANDQFLAAHQHHRKHLLSLDSNDERHNAGQ